jgi:hypothetical protein
MSKVKRLSLFGICVVLISNLMILALGGAIISPQKAHAIGVNAPNAPQPGQEVGYWVGRHQIVLFNNTVAFAEGTEYATTTLTNVRYFDSSRDYSGDYDEDLNGGISMRKGRSVEVYKGTENSSCTLTVNFPYTAAIAPANGTLSSQCPNTDKSVKLEKLSNGIIDGFYSETNNNEQIDMPIIVEDLSGCGFNGGSDRVGGDNSDGYKNDVSFNKEDGSSGNGHSYNYKKSQSNAGIDILGSQSGDGPFRARQFAWCGDDNSGRSDYGDEPGTTYSGDDGRDIYISKTSFDDTYTEISEDIAEFLTQKQQQGEFFDFFVGAKLDGARFCYASSFDTFLSDGAIKQLAVDTLIGPIPGPFFECLHDFFADDPDFNRIDNLRARIDGQPPNPSSGDDNDCGGDIPIISDLACNLVKWTFDTIFELFTSVIDFFSNPPAILTDQGTGDQLTKIWAVLRNLANIIFILAFLLVVFQYITNYNVVDAYFIKKFIPRLVIAVVLVQASGWITKELMFFFDDLGSSIQAILFSAADLTRENGFEIGGGAATVAAFAGPALIGILLPIGLIMLIVLIITIIVLAVRYVAIIVLAIFAPLAFACLAIPQLEGTFKKWLKTYVTLLAMYPIIMMFFSASSIVSSVLNDGGTLLQILALIVQFMPFIVLPFTFKMAGGIMGTISGKLTDLSKKGAKAGWNASGTKADLDKYKGMRKQAKDAKSDERVANRLKDMKSGDTRRSRLAKRGLLRGMDDSSVDRYAGGFADKVEKRKQEEAAGQAATVSKNAVDEVRTNGVFRDARGVRHLNERDASLASLRDQAVSRARANDYVGADAAMTQLLNEGGDTPYAGEVRDSLGAGSAEWDALRTASYTPLAAVRADLAAGPGKTGWDVASTVEKQAGQKKEFWEGAVKDDTLKAMSTISGVESAGGSSASRLTMSSTEAAGHAANEINGGTVNLGEGHLDHLYATHTALESRVKQLQGGPVTPATTASIASAQRAITAIEAEIVRR